MKNKWVVILGDLAAGVMAVHGPYETAELADEGRDFLEGRTGEVGTVYELVKLKP